MEISKMIDRGTRLLTEAGYTSSRIYTYKWLWKKGILVYMSKIGRLIMMKNLVKNSF